MKLLHKGIILVSVPLIFELGTLAALGVATTRAVEEARAAAASSAFVAQANVTLNLFLEAGTALIAFKFTHAPSQLDRYAVAARKVPDAMARLKTLSGTEARRQHHVSKLDMISNDLIVLMNRYGQPKPPGDEGLLEAFNRTHKYRQQLESLFEPFRNEVEQISQEEHDLQEVITRDAERSRQQIHDLWYAVGFLSVVITVLLAIFFLISIKKRLAVVGDNARRFGQRKPLAKQISGNDEIAELDKEFHKMADDLLSMENSKQQFVRMITHDLKTPLTSIRGLLLLLKDATYGELSEKGVKRVEGAENSLARVIRMINELLDLDKIQSGMLELDCGDTRLMAVIEQALDTVRLLAEKASITILSSGDEQLTIYGDFHRLVQVVINLLSNAIKFSPAGSVININVKKESKYVTVSITDRGLGIPRDKIDDLFKPFVQARKSDSKDYKGTGLGLAICKAVVEAHQGRLGVESREGEGSRFWFSLPLKSKGATAPTHAHANSADASCAADARSGSAAEGSSADPSSISKASIPPLLLLLLALSLSVGAAWADSPAPASDTARAGLLLKSGDYRGCIQKCQSAYAHNEYPAYNVYTMAVCYERLGDKVKALQFYRFVNDKFPDTDEARQAMVQLVRLDPTAGNPSTAAPPVDQALIDRPKIATFSRNHFGHMVVTAYINGSPASMIFDTGAAGCFITSTQLAHFGIKLDTKRSGARMMGVGGETDAAVGLATVQVGGLVRTNVPIFVQDTHVADGDENANDPSMGMGLLGQTFLGDLAYEIDSQSRRITFKAPSDDATLKRDPNSVPYRVVDNCIVVTPKVNGRECDMFLDTGASCITFTDGQFAAMELTRPTNAARGGTAGVGGQRVGYMFDVDKVQLDAIEREHVESAISIYSRMPYPLLGQSFLQGLTFTIEPKLKIIHFN